jgi:CubicO group peptidase (beta-lactamase class C family)
MNLSPFGPEIEEMVGSGMEKHGVPGVAVGMSFEGDRYVRAFGITNINHPLTVDADTLFQIGSTTKTVTATALMHLVERGQISLDDPLLTHLPDLRLADHQVTSRVTLRHLLTHTAGWESDLFNDYGPGNDALATAVAHMHELPQVTPLGAVWNYSNSGYMLAGRLLEVVMGTTYEGAIRQLVLEPLGMKLSTFFADEAITHGVAVGHASVNEKASVAEPWSLPRSFNPTGGLVSSANDQLRYAEFHLGRSPDPGKVLGPESLALMQSPLVRASGGRAVFSGLSWLLQRTPGLIAHGGATNGQRAAFVLVPSRQFAMTVLTNSDAGGLVHRPLVKWALRNVVQLHAEAPPLIPVQPDSLNEYEGRYVTREQVVTVRAGPSGLALSIERSVERSQAFAGERHAQMTASVFEGDVVRITEGPESGTFAEFARDQQGTIAWLTIFGRIHVRGARSRSRH